jgi:UDP-2,3-diacylglucosamine pyrophosphatase LpxH
VKNVSLSLKEETEIHNIRTSGGVNVAINGNFDAVCKDTVCQKLKNCVLLANVYQRLQDYTVCLIHGVILRRCLYRVDIHRVLAHNTSLFVRYIHLPPTGCCKRKDKHSFKTPQGLSSIWRSGKLANFLFPADKVGDEQ